jgi:predicted HNH restriction endonuclease
LTDVENMVLLCSRCHHDLHHGRYTITMDTDGIPQVQVGRSPPIPVGI